MNTLIKSDLVSEYRSDKEIVYIISEKQLFYDTGYKILQSQHKNGFLKCSKVNYNGKIKLTYPVSDVRTLEAMAREYTPEQFIEAVKSILKMLDEIKNIGFFQYENIGNSLRDIFCDVKTGKIKLLYIPIDIKTAPNSYIVFETQIRETIVSAAKANKNTVNKTVAAICREVSDIRKIGSNEIVAKIESGEYALTAKEGRSSFDKYAPKVEHRNPQTATPKSHSSSSTAPPVKSYQKESISQTKRQIQQQADDERQELERKNAKEKEKRKNFDTVTFLISYLVIMSAAVVLGILVKNYLSQTQFVIMLAVTLMIVFSVPAFWFTRKKDKKKRTVAMHEEKDTRTMIEGRFAPPIVLRTINEPIKTEFFINVPEYVIGKSAASCDGVIPLDKTIGDVHGKIVWEGKGYFILDMESEHGTFVNEVRVIPGQKFPLKNGDKVRLSKKFFEVVEI